MSDLSSIISGAVADAGIGGDSDGGGETSVVESTTTETERTPEVEASAETTEKVETPAAETRTPEQVEEDELRALETELVGKTPGLAKGRISVLRHQAVLSRARNKAAAELKAATEKYSKYESNEYRQMERIMELAEFHPETFFREVVLQNPTYAKLVEAEFERRGMKVPAEVKAAADEETPLGEEPKPDVLDANGNLGYSAEASKKLVAYHQEKERRENNKRFKDLDAKVKPILDARQEAEVRAGYVQQANTALEVARKSWEGFAENEQAIYEFMMEPENRSLTLKQGYDIWRKFNSTRSELEAKIRKDTIASLNVATTKTKPVRPGLPATTADDADAPRDTAALVREAMAGANLS